MLYLFPSQPRKVAGREVYALWTCELIVLCTVRITASLISICIDGKTIWKPGKCNCQKLIQKNHTQEWYLEKVTLGLAASVSIFLFCFKVITSFTSAQCQLSVKSSEVYWSPPGMTCSMKWMLWLSGSEMANQVILFGLYRAEQNMKQSEQIMKLFLSSWLGFTLFSTWIMADTVGKCDWCLDRTSQHIPAKA